MKKVVLPIGIIALAGTLFSAVGWYFVRGIKIYSLNTSFGLVLSGSWKLCLTATIIVWVVFAFAFVKLVLNKKADAAISKLEADGKKRNKDGKIEPTAATVIMPVNAETGAMLKTQHKTNDTSGKADNSKVTAPNTDCDATELAVSFNSSEKELTQDNDATQLITPQTNSEKEFADNDNENEIQTAAAQMTENTAKVQLEPDDDATQLLCNSDNDKKDNIISNNGQGKLSAAEPVISSAQPKAKNKNSISSKTATSKIEPKAAAGVTNEKPEPKAVAATNKVNQPLTNNTCPLCKAAIKPDNKFCTSCGAKLQ